MIDDVAATRKFTYEPVALLDQQEYLWKSQWNAELFAQEDEALEEGRAELSIEGAA